MLNHLVLIVVSAFAKAGKEADKNGVANVFLTPVAGKIPNQAMVVAGTVAEKAGLTIGSKLLVQITERKGVALDSANPNSLTRQFNHTVIGPVTTGEVITLRKELGEPFVIDTTATVENPTGAAGITPSLKVSTSKVPTEANGQEEEEYEEEEAK